MRYQEYGLQQKETILLLHGGGLSWWNYREAAELLQNEYHIILPILDGHAGSDRPFTTIEENASEIISFIDKYMNGSVLLIGGLCRALALPRRAARLNGRAAAGLGAAAAAVGGKCHRTQSGGQGGDQRQGGDLGCQFSHLGPPSLLHRVFRPPRTACPAER